MLSKETLTNAVLQHVALTESRNQRETKDGVQINRDPHRKVFEMLQKLSENIGNYSTLPQPSNNAGVLRCKALDMVRSINQVLETKAELIENLKSISDKNSNDDDMFSMAPRCRLNIENDLKVIKNVYVAAIKNDKAYSKNDIENIAAKRVDNMVDNRI